MAERPDLDEDKGGKLIDPTRFHGMVGSLMYLSASRPDIVFAVCMCARYQAKPTEMHLTAIKRIFRYLKGTINMGLWYPKDSGFELKAFADADYAGCHDTRRSTSGSAQFLGHRLVRCCAQISGCDSATLRLWICVQQYSDEQVERKVVELYFVETKYQLADIFTKALPRERFATLLPLLGVKQMSPETLKELQDESVSESKGRTVADSIAERLTRPTAYKFKTDCSIIPVWRTASIRKSDTSVLEDLKALSWKTCQEGSLLNLSDHSKYEHVGPKFSEWRIEEKITSNSRKSEIKMKLSNLVIQVSKIEFLQKHKSVTRFKRKEMKAGLPKKVVENTSSNIQIQKVEQVRSTQTEKTFASTLHGDEGSKVERQKTEKKHVILSDQKLVQINDTLEVALVKSMNIEDSVSQESKSDSQEEDGVDKGEESESEGLFKLALGGRNFTWMNKAGTKMSKLDRFLISHQVMDAFTDVKVTALPHGWSDHTPIMLHCDKVDYGSVLFKIFHSWLQRDRFDECIKKAYNECFLINPQMPFHEKLKVIKQNIKGWKHQVKNVEVARKQEVMLKLIDIETKIDSNIASDIKKEDRVKLLKERDDLQQFEDMHFMQKTNVQWDLEGDENTKNFTGS
ncbi:copia protein [Tanacetum coccineum]